MQGVVPWAGPEAVRLPPDGTVPTSRTEWAVCPWWGVQGRPRKGPAENRPRLDVVPWVCRP
ncbi:hypothetical protein CRV15_16330 [Streptomyces clavuligerus]|uniref:Uncharacterized protein n=1 Tax=Streptomyces clavuligerus TaxID=1901 RepID=B5GPD8_STRCL|nr:hypothetical protein D1794_16975 [Streptomyces clavuligerus]EDY48184.1 hypothetical protein SSCG_01465 [Streptomyces clavuligerus]EFG07506.1 Hypothetical protein SCLAV_2433 [Streptomyces clavuligerus]QCS07048.1 hypothetical protein CRV15_16330 [Streptomyces clavuligerus]QPJ93594.1 hypothetical protein GE265_11705 [Streptomyces clavuligerus]